MWVGEPDVRSRDMGNIGKCLDCDGQLDKVIPSIFVMNTIHKSVPHLMVTSCLKCHKEFLIERAEPHGIRGTVVSIPKGEGYRQSIFWADEGELIVGGEERV